MNPLATIPACLSFNRACFVRIGKQIANFDLHINTDLIAWAAPPVGPIRGD
jgi:hypothetical protein